MCFIFPDMHVQDASRKQLIEFAKRIKNTGKDRLVRFGRKEEKYTIKLVQGILIHGRSVKHLHQLHI
jgi:hypothetical protein